MNATYYERAHPAPTNAEAENKRGAEGMNNELRVFTLALFRCLNGRLPERGANEADIRCEKLTHYH